MNMKKLELLENRCEVTEADAEMDLENMGDDKTVSKSSDDPQEFIIPIQKSKEAASVYGEALYAAYSHDILTNDQLRESEYYGDFFLASFHLARALVRDNSSKLRTARTLNAFDLDDWSQTLSIVLVKKYETIVEAMRRESNENILHNHKAYCTSILDNLLKDYLRKTYQKKVVESVDEDGVTHHTSEVVVDTDENGVKHKKQYSNISGSTPLSEDEKGTTTLLDTFVSTGRTPEEEHIFRDTDESSRKRIQGHLRWLKSKKNKGRLLAFVEIGLYEGGTDYRSRIKNISAICAHNPKEIVKIYNQDFTAYAHYVHLPETEIADYLIKDIGELGFSEENLRDDAKFRDMVAKWKNRNKEELERRLAAESVKKDTLPAAVGAVVSKPVSRPAAKKAAGTPDGLAA